ncbi:MAG: peptidoglycan DD-metalloendopeptidase family protein [Dehalococcoidia bacterium]
MSAVVGAAWFAGLTSADAHDGTLAAAATLPGLPAVSNTTLADVTPAAELASNPPSRPAATVPSATPSPAAADLPSWVTAALAATQPAPSQSAATPGAPTATLAPEGSASDQRQTALQNQATPTPTASPTPAAPPPLYQTYTVRAGDTVSGIAARSGVRTQDIINNNVGVISAGSLLLVGARLQIPTVPGVLHNISVGETLADIAEHYGVTVDDIVGFPGNRIDDPSNVLEGTQILVVNGIPPVVQAAPAAATPEATPSAEAASTPEPTPVAPPKPVYQFIWPLVGNITSYFGPAHPLGIDISAAFQPVAASASGKVVFVGGDPCCSYGYYIDIQHADGYMTRYGHLSKFLVSLGQQVSQGDTIAISGNTGYSTGAHLHFEIRKNGAVRNPLDFLP